MNAKDSNLKIEPHEQSPLVNRLVFIIETLQSQLVEQSERIGAQSEKIDLLLAEIRQLKKLPAKPNIKPSTLPKEPKDPDDKNPPAIGSSRVGRHIRRKVSFIRTVMFATITRIYLSLRKASRHSLVPIHASARVILLIY